MATSRLLLLLLLTTGNLLLLLTAAAPVDDICLQTKDPPRCVTILMSTDTRTPAAPLPVLVEVAIEAAMYSTGVNKNAADDLFLFAKDLKGVYGNCRDLYQDVLDALLSAPANLGRRNYAKLVEAAGIVDRAVSGCAAAFGNNAALVRGNADASVEAEAIAIIARNLR